MLPKRGMKMQRLIIIKNTELNSEFALPVTPSQFTIGHGVRIETINIHTLGDVNIAGYPTLATIKIDCMFPAQYYPFCNFQNMIAPYEYVKLIQNYIDNKPLLRLVVSGTTINLPVKVESIEFGEKDGTNDVYATLTFREFKELTAVKAGTTKTGSSTARASSAAATPVKSAAYTAARGDTLSSICRKQYGDASLYAKLAKYNGIKNPNILKTGQIIKMPAKSQL